MMKTIVRERYDGNGKLIERIVETEQTLETISPAYVPIPYQPWPGTNPWVTVTSEAPMSQSCQSGQNVFLTSDKIC